MEEAKGRWVHMWCVEAWRGVWRHGGGCVCLGGGCAEEEWGRWLRWMSLHCVRGHKEVEPWGGVVGGGCGGCVRMCGGRMEGVWRRSVHV